MRLSDFYKRQTWILVGLLSLALVLRVIRIQSRGIWYDDAFSIFLSEQSFERIVAGTAADTMPPLYYFLLHLWLSLTHQLWFLRSLNVILSLGIVLLLYLLGKRLFGKAVGFWAAFFTAISPLQIYHAQELRMYAVLALALLGYVWFFVRIWLRMEADPLGPVADVEPSRSRPLVEPGPNPPPVEPRPNPPPVEPGRNPGVVPTLAWTFGQGWLDWLGLILCGAAAMYSHNLAIFTIIAPNIFLLIKRRWRLLGFLLVAQAGIGLLALPWLTTIPGQIAKIQNAFWTPRPGLVEILQAITIFHTNMPLPAWLLPVAVIVSIQILVLVVIETVRAGRGDTKVQFVSLVIVTPPILMFVASYFMRPIFVPRAFMLSSLAYYVLLGRAIVTARSRSLGVILAGAFTILVLLALPFQYTFNQFPRSPFQRMTESLRQVVNSSDVILHDNKLSYFPAAFYAPDLAQEFLPDEPGSHNDTLAPASQEAMRIYPVADLTEAVGNAQRVWFVVFEEAIQEYQSQGKIDHPVISELEMKYTLAQKQTFNDLLVYEFTR
jgi:mannosyltransferase